MDLKDTKSKVTFSGLALLLVVIVSLLASVITNVAIENWFDSYGESLQAVDSFSLLSMTKPEPLPGTYEESLQKAREVGRDSLAYLAVKTEDSTNPLDWITADDNYGVGVVVTADGWILFQDSNLPRQSVLLTSYEVWIKDERYQIAGVKTDSLTDFIMIKVTASDLTAVNFGASSEMRSGSMIFALGGADNIFETSISDSDYFVGDTVDRAEIFTTAWQLKESLPSGLPLFNSSGMFVGFSNDSGVSLLHHASNFISAVIKNQTDYYSGIGIYVVDVDSVLNLSDNLTYGYSYGALIYAPNSYTRAVATGGPADLAGLQPGDLILSVNGTMISGRTSLADLLAAHSVGDSIRLQVVSESGIEDKEVVLFNYQEINY